MKKLAFILLLLLNSSILSQDYWQKLNIPSTANLHLCFSDSTDGIIATFGNSTLFRSSDRGDSWTLKSENVNNSGLYGEVVTSDNRILGLIRGPGAYIGPGYYLIHSSNFGTDWDTLLGNHYGFEFSRPFFNPSNSAIYISTHDYYSSNGGIYFTNDFGINWEPISNTDFIGLHTYLPWMYMPNQKIVLCQFNYVCKSTDNGYTWTVSNAIGENYEEINGLAINQREGIFVIEENNGVYFANFDTLSFFYLGLSNKKLSSIAVRDTLVFASSDSLGVFKYDKQTDRWVDVSSGLDDLRITKIFFDKAGNLYARSRENLYRAYSELTTISNEKIGTLFNFRLAQNYPNPFNPSTIISYQIPQTGFISLKVYDILGREVVTLVNEEKPAGNYEVEFDGRELTSGIYFYKLSVSALPSQDRQAGNYIETRKMILLR
jgi:photosystem II stability/assembly factor-like uncharacterized protein